MSAAPHVGGVNKPNRNPVDAVSEPASECVGNLDRWSSDGGRHLHLNVSRVIAGRDVVRLGETRRGWRRARNYLAGS